MSVESANILDKLPLRGKRRTANATATWLEQLAKRGDRILGDERNVLRALHVAPPLQGLLRFNAFALTIEFTKSPPWRAATAGDTWRDEDDVALQAWLQDHGVQVRARAAVADTVPVVAREVCIHPVQEYLRALRWDGRERLTHWLVDFLCAEGDRDYLHSVAVRFLISAVARALNPGCQADHVLVLEGTQGIGKSRSVRALAVRPEWFADNVPDIRGKDAPLQLAGRWIVELAELAAVRRADLEAVKAFISRPADVFRAPYARSAGRVPRQCVFIATTNEAEYLRDPTGNRRFWPVRCGHRIDVEGLTAAREQLYAEAVTRYDAGERWHLDDAEGALAIIEQRERVLVTEVQSCVAEYLDRLAVMGILEVTTRQVFVDALGLDPAHATFAESCRRLGGETAQAIQRAGWHRVAQKGRGERRRVVYRRS